MESKPVVMQESTKSIFVVPANLPKPLPQPDFNHSENKPSPFVSADTLPKHSGKLSPKQFSKPINNEKDISKWIKVVGKSSPNHQEPMIDGYENPMDALENVINNLEAHSTNQSSKPILSNASRPSPPKEPNFKEDYIINLFTQTIEESQENNGFFELHKAEAKDNTKGKKELSYVEPVRNKEERAKLKGQVCNECKKV